MYNRESETSLWVGVGLWVFQNLLLGLIPVEFCFLGGRE